MPILHSLPASLRYIARYIDVEVDFGHFAPHWSARTFIGRGPGERPLHSPFCGRCGRVESSSYVVIVKADERFGGLIQQNRENAANLQLVGEPHDQVGKPLHNLRGEVWSCMPTSLGHAFL